MIESVNCLDWDYQNTLGSGYSVNVNAEYYAYSANGNLLVNQTITVSPDDYGDLKITAVSTISASPF